MLQQLRTCQKVRKITVFFCGQVLWTASKSAAGWDLFCIFSYIFVFSGNFMFFSTFLNYHRGPRHPQVAPKTLPRRFQDASKTLPRRLLLGGCCWEAAAGRLLLGGCCWEAAAERLLLGGCCSRAICENFRCFCVES